MSKTTKIFEIQLDTKRPLSNEKIELVAGDTGNVFEISLVDDGEPVDLSNCRVVAVFAHTGGTSLQDSDTAGNGVTVLQNKITIELRQASYRIGTTECEIQVYSGALAMGKDQKVRILPRGQNDGTEAIVRTGMSSISDPNQPEVQIIYRLRNTKEKGWQVIDVNVEGVWLVSNYRNQYGSIAAQEGIDGLIARMQERLANPQKAETAKK